MPDRAMMDKANRTPSPVKKARLARRLGRALETHIALPLFALLALFAIWIATFHFIAAERQAAVSAARDATREQVDTYEAQVVRNLTAIDQTLKVLKYAVEQHGPAAALDELRRQGLLPPSLMFVVGVTDRDGRIVASNPAMPRVDVSRETFFSVHREGVTGTPFVSRVIGDAARSEPHLHFTRRIDDADGRFAGVAIVAVDPAYFAGSYEHSRAGELGLAGLIGADGVARALRIGDKLSWGQQVQLDHLADDAVDPHATAPDGVVRYTSVRRLPGFPLSAVIGL
ncbi:MAG: PDC sensor domain-containing protein, partial [Ramlibacter sp.]